MLDAPGALPGSDRLVEPLSEREIEVLRLLASGRSNRDIAGELFVTLDTVKKHVTHILGKLEVVNRTEAAVRARSIGLVDDNVHLLADESGTDRDAGRYAERGVSSPRS
jgi:LuxR family maltose regulon positive regulatory protein